MGSCFCKECLYAEFGHECRNCCSHTYSDAHSHEGHRDVVKHIAEQFQPEKIILFGSYVYGKPRPESDVDLLVIMSTPLRNHEQAAQITAESSIILVLICSSELLSKLQKDWI